MTVYKLESDVNNFLNLVVDNERDWQQFETFAGRPMPRTWKVLRVRAPKDRGRRRTVPSGDFPSFLSHVPVFSSRAHSGLAPLIDPFGEWAPLQGVSEEYWAFNVLDLRDALDHGASECKLFRDGTVMDIERYVFLSNRIQGAVIFKIPETPRMDVFVTDRFVVEVRALGLQGLEFRELWRDASL